MAITFRQENNGYENVIEISGELWSFEPEDYEKCSKFLISKRIPFITDYSIFNSNFLLSLNAKIAFQTKELAASATSEIEGMDAETIKTLTELISWKIKGTRKKVEVV